MADNAQRRTSETAADGGGWRQITRSRVEGADLMVEGCVRVDGSSGGWLLRILFFCPFFARTIFFCPLFARGSHQNKTLKQAKSGQICSLEKKTIPFLCRGILITSVKGGSSLAPFFLPKWGAIGFKSPPFPPKKLILVLPFQEHLKEIRRMKSSCASHNSKRLFPL